MVTLKLNALGILIIILIYFQWRVTRCTAFNGSVSENIILSSGIQMKRPFQYYILGNVSKFKPYSLVDLNEKNDVRRYTNLFVIQIGEEKNVRTIETDLGLRLIRKVFDDEDFYLFRHSLVSHRSKRNAGIFLDKIANDTRVQWVVQQLSLDRQKRSWNSKASPYIQRRLIQIALRKRLKDFLENSERSGSPSRTLTFNDPLYVDQWYLHNKGQTGAPPQNDINVLPVWRAGISGSGVRVSVLDDGVSESNPEVMSNYDPLISYDFNELTAVNDDPIPENSHGTYCAAIVAGVANNRLCGVGVAYDAKVGGTSLLNGLVTDVQEAMALVHALDYVDIYTASWGPKDDGKHLAGPGLFTRKALIKGVTKGREGKGAIYVWAAGNGGIFFDNCNMDGYASSIYTLTFGALTDDGRSTYYTEPCASVLASTYVGGLHLPPTKKNVVSYHKMIKVIVPEAGGKCRETFQGTSASAPMAAGVIALVLQTNPNLSWRDVQHLVIETARIPSAFEKGWSVNGAGRHFHLKVGFGVLDAARMVSTAQNWTSVKPIRIWTSPKFANVRSIKPGRVTILSMDTITQQDWPVDVLEAVVATVDIIHPRCKDLEIFLVSPHGTVSQILTKRPLDNNTILIPMWEFVSLHFWGENPKGEWMLKIFDNGHFGLEEGVIDFFSLTMYGTKSEEQPQPMTRSKFSQTIETEELDSMMKKELRPFGSVANHRNRNEMF